MKDLKYIPFHPLVFALYPALFLYSHNIGMLQLHHIYRSVFFILVGSIILWAVLHLLMRHHIKSALITTFFLVLFFSYGHVQSLLGNFSERIFGIDRDLYLSAHYTIMSIILIIIIVRADNSNIGKVTQYTNTFGIILILIPSLTIFQFTISKPYTLKDDLFKHIDPYVDLNQKSGELPDIYYIILDGYAREDVLMDLYEYDNSEFYTFLEERGFLIARNSYANYAQTMPSLSSSLNMNYIQDLLPDIELYEHNREPLAEFLNDNLVAKLLREYGYGFVVFSTGYSGTEISNSDVYLSPDFTLNEFENMVLNMTPVRFVAELLPVRSQYDLHIDRIIYTFDMLPLIANNHSPAFVFAHLIVPHPPFIFNDHGVIDELPIGFSYSDGNHYHDYNIVVQNEYKDGYLNQLKYVNKQIISTIDGILKNSEIPPVIILQSDHGPGLMLHWEKPEKTDYRERMGILNAYYVNDVTQEFIYDSITPVNTFRIVFNSYFNSSLPLLEDRSYFSRWSLPYNFYEISNINQ